MNTAFSIPDLAGDLRQLMVQIPAGRVTTFGRLAAALGDASSARGIAHWLLNSSGFAGLPRHRVLVRDGSVGDPSWPAAVERAALLAAEGVPFIDGRAELSQCLWDEFVTHFPLATLRQQQAELWPRVSLTASPAMPALVGGVDLSYIDDETGIAALAIVDAASGELCESYTVQRPVTFPYLTGYLSFREIPLHLALQEERRARGLLIPDVLLVDGSGILHERRAGIATHLGVVTGLCTIGVTKTFLTGDVDFTGMSAGETRPIVVEGTTAGFAIQPRATGKPIFVSPGHRASPEFARDLVLKLLCGRRLPSPIWWADRLSREAKTDNPPRASATGPGLSPANGG